MLDEIQELLKELKELRNEMVAKNYPFQQLSNIILKYDDKVADELHHRDMDPITEDDD